MVTTSGGSASSVNLTIRVGSAYRTLSFNVGPTGGTYTVPADAPAGTAYTLTATAYNAQRTPTAVCTAGFTTS